MSNDGAPDPMQEVFALFRTDGGEYVERITELLLVWERGEIDEEGLEELFRAAHSLKGSASTLGVDNLAGIAHAMEDVFGAVRRGEIKYDAELASDILAALDVISEILARAEPGKEEPPTAATEAVAARVRRVGEEGGELEAPASPPAEPAAEPAPPAEKKTPASTTGRRGKGEETVRLPVDKLDAVLDGFSELWEEKFRNDEFGLRLRHASALVRAVNKTLGETLELYRRRGETKELLAGVERAGVAINSADREMRALDFDFHAGGQRFALDLAGFGDELGRLRMAPLRGLFRSFRRPVRDLATRLGKAVKLEVVGEDNELDRTVIESLKDPLNHILRNAIYHGLENADTRRDQGKPLEGRILISGARIGSRLLIEIEDDGGGLDLEGVKEAARARGAIRAEAAEALGPEEIARLIFEPGVSTRKEADEVGGRGVGLDVVATNVTALGGTVDVWSAPGVGTRFTIQIPLTIATARGMLVEAGGGEFIVPSAAIRHVELVPASDFETVGGKPVLRLGGKVIATGNLATMLEVDGAYRPEGHSPVLILASPSGEAALVVSEVRSEGEFLTKDLGAGAALMPYFGAAHVTGKGEIVLILNADVLIREIIQGEISWRATSAPAAEPSRRTILVVDDSLTTRVLEKNILEAAGYDVVVATDGKEALAVLAKEACDLAIVDIQMPTMDGYELTRQLRGSPEFRDLPIIIVTSLDTDRDMARGLEAGADAYLKKSHFNQRELLSLVEQLI